MVQKWVQELERLGRRDTSLVSDLEEETRLERRVRMSRLVEQVCGSSSWHSDTVKRQQRAFQRPEIRHAGDLVG